MATVLLTPPVETRSAEAVDIRVRLRRPGLGREARWRGGAGGRPPAVRASAVRGPGCPCLPGGRWRCSRRVIPGRGTSLLGTAPPRLFAQAQSSDFARLCGNPEPPRALLPARPCVVAHLFWLLRPPTPCVRREGSEVQGITAAPATIPPGYQRGVPRLSAWPGRLQRRPGDSGGRGNPERKLLPPTDPSGKG